MTLRVMQVLLSPRIGGAETLAAGLETSWHDNGLETMIVYLDEAQTDPCRLRRALLRWVRLAQNIRRYSPDLVVAHSALPALYSRVQPGAWARCISVLHSAGDDFAGGRLLGMERLLQVNTPAVVAVSQDQADTYSRHFPRHKRINVIPNGVREHLTQKSVYARRARKIVAIARVAAQKDPDTWLGAARELVSEDPDLDFTWWGPDERKPGSTKMQSVGKGVRFAGPTADPELVLLNSDIYFHTAVQEAHSIGLLEAAAVGIPIVCADTVGRTLPTHLPRTTFTAGDASSAAAALRGVLVDYASHAALARAAAPVIREEYGMNKVSARYEALFAELIKDQN